MSITLTRLLRQLAAEFAQSEFEPVRYELPIRQGGEVAPLELMLENGVRVSVEGIVDRVDLMEKDGKKYVRVVDYKSGSKNFQLDDVYYGLNLQMLIYLFSIWKTEQESLQTVFRQGYSTFRQRITSSRLPEIPVTNRSRRSIASVTE